MKVGVPTEIKTAEYRVAITPAGVREMSEHGHRVLVQAGAGEGSAIADSEYEAQGATIVPEAAPVFAPLTVQFWTVFVDASAMKRIVDAVAVLEFSIVSAFPPLFRPSMTTLSPPSRVGGDSAISVTGALRVVSSGSSLSGSAHVRANVRVTPRLPPREPGVSVRSPAPDVPDVVRNPERD